MTSPNQAALDTVESEIDRINTKLGQAVSIVQGMPTGSLDTPTTGGSVGGTPAGGITPSNAAPARPTGLTGTVQSDRTLHMTWDSAPDATSWQVHELLKDPANTLKDTVTTPAAVRGPLAGGSYRYGIVPLNANGPGPMSLTIDVTVGASGGTSTTTGGGTTTSTSQLGKTTDGASSSTSTSDKTVVSQFTPTVSGTITAGHARLWTLNGLSWN